MTDSIVVCHSALTDLLGSQLEPLAVVQQVEQHRRYWRPEKPRLVLLAESHVYTTEDELCRTVEVENVLDQAPKDLPRGFVRFVYCLGYGENKLLDKCIESNPGTWQFWKIFYSCINPVTLNASFAPVLKGTTKLPEDRIGYKLKLLQQMKDHGIWLVDASIAALYRPRQSKPPVLYEQFLQTSWKEHVRSTIEEWRPKGILCIGCGVARTLKERLDELQIPWSVVPQPGARLPSEEHLRVFKKYREVAMEPSRVRSLCKDWCSNLFS
ncbi:MAG: hypothetical protein WCE53_01180 [Candidatus Acidiferrum sp.]